ncbi:RNA polymerase sigma factor [uncultured Dysosmobacter sp.]|uniref:RNA polymerase sigma factor n=1 Tax=uncultured Dysosmobacter sp. TaxID=2591384 RepID=UPI002628FB23|nr:sigma-70 family RNA polymerase sigma factor [uncultured Dysosmobacter sp.]
MTDQELLTQLDHTPDAALTELTARYAPLAAAIAGRVLPGRQEDIEEIAADTLIKIWQAGDSLAAETLRGFVITTARNLAIDRWRVLRRRAEAPLFDNDAEDSAFLEQHVLGSLLAEYIRALSPPDGEIFLRHYLLLETAAEIGARYALTESAVRARLHRVRKLLQKEVPL